MDKPTKHYDSCTTTGQLVEKCEYCTRRFIGELQSKIAELEADLEWVRENNKRAATLVTELEAEVERLKLEEHAAQYLRSEQERLGEEIRTLKERLKQFEDVTGKALRYLESEDEQAEAYDILYKFRNTPQPPQE